jgi:hypothetical protein
MALPFMAMLPGILQGVGGLAQSIFGGGRARRAEKELEKLQTPVYQQSQGINDYYTKALNRYSADPTKSSLYQTQMQNIQRGGAAGMQALGDRRGAASGVANIVQAQNDAALQATAAAEQQQAQALGQLGQAAQLKAGEEKMAFQYNQVAPYEKKAALLGAKAAGGNQMMNAGLSNVFGAANTFGQMKFDDYLMGKYYGKN